VNLRRKWSIVVSVGACVAGIATGCVSSSIERQQLTDGSWRLSCRLPMGDCVREIDKICAGNDYDILSGRAGHRAYGLAALPSESSTAEVIVRCGGPRGSEPPAGAADAHPAPVQRDD
jgi:hypothetical protein